MRIERFEDITDICINNATLRVKKGEDQNGKPLREDDFGMI